MNATASASCYHITGAAGVGMNAIAQMLAFRGCTVSGSDRYLDQGKTMDVLERLERAGVRLTPQDGSGVTPATNGVVVSTAIEADNPDVQKAKALGIPIIHRARMLADCIGSAPSAAIAGTCGKTTVTGMTGWLLEQSGLDPFTVNGGAVIGWDAPDRTGNVRPSAAQEQPLWVIEADESDRSFLVFEPDWAIITNISQDHFSLEESIALFNEFAQRVKRKIICTPAVARVLSSIPPGKIVLADDQTIARDTEGWYFVWEGLRFRVGQPGRHNAENALLACTLAREIGCSAETLQAALPQFPGIRRRLENKGRCRGVTLMDDYAHNPEKIRAAWTTLKEQYQPVTAIWRPHGFGPLAAMQQPLTDVFRELACSGDTLYVLPVYYAGGSTNRVLTAEQFAASLQTVGVPAVYAPDYDFLLRDVPQRWRPGGVLLCMGARDPDLPLFPERLIQFLKTESGTP